MRLLLLHVHRAILSHAAVSPLIQPLAPLSSFPLSRLPQLCSHLSGLRIQPLSAGLFIRVRAEGPGLPPWAGSAPASIFSVSGFFQSWPSLPPMLCPSSPPPPAPSQEIATIYHDQQSPSNPKGRAINFRDTVASGFRARSSGCVQGTLRLLAPTSRVHKHRSPLPTLSPSGLSTWSWRARILQTRTLLCF